MDMFIQDTFSKEISLHLSDKAGDHSQHHLPRNSHHLVVRKVASSPRGVLRPVGCAECDVPTTDNNVTSQTKKNQRIENETKQGRHEHLCGIHICLLELLVKSLAGNM